MKRIFAVVCIATLLLCGCTAIKEVSDTTEGLPEETIETEVLESEVSETEAAVPETEIVLPEVFSVVYEDTILTPGDSYTESLFPETEDSTVTPDCRTNQTATVYYYDGFNVQTISGAEGEYLPYISTIELTGTGVQTPEGIGIGSGKEAVFQTYGEDYMEQFGGYVWSAGQTTLSVYFDAEEKVQYLVLGLDESLFEAEPAEQTEEVQEPAAEESPVTEESEDSPEKTAQEITFTGISVKRFSSWQTENDYIGDVHAYDGDGNEIPFTYEIYKAHSDVITEDLDFGVGVVVFTAQDSAGNTARAWQNIFIETFTEEDEASIANYAAVAGDDLVGIKTYLQNSVHFSTTYGMPNPVGYAAEWGKGNCYIHARLLWEVLNYKGYECVLLWSTTCRHYWVLVHTDLGWRHLDATPLYEYYTAGLQTDAERIATKSDRPWDTTIWPAAE